MFLSFLTLFRFFGLFDFSTFRLFLYFSILFGLFGLFGFSTFRLFGFSCTFRAFRVFLLFDFSTFRVFLFFSTLFGFFGFSTFRLAGFSCTFRAFRLFGFSFAFWACQLLDFSRFPVLFFVCLQLFRCCCTFSECSAFFNLRLF